MSDSLAWAAGFFDGEGSSYLSQGNLLHVRITQKEPSVLERFRDAVGAGKIYGPYEREDGRQQWHYAADRYQDAKSVLELLWPWLSEPKRQQATRALGRAHVPGRTNALKTHCKSGHAFTVTNTMVDKHGWRRCRACHNARCKVLRTRPRAVLA